MLQTNVQQGLWLRIPAYLQNAIYVIGFLLLTNSIIMLAMMVPYHYMMLVGDAITLPTLMVYIFSGITFFLFIPFLFCKYIFKVSLTTLGLCFPKITYKNIFITLAAICLMLPFTYYFSQHAYLRKHYSLANLNLAAFLFVILMLEPMYYYAEEFFFRGFLFLTLWRRIGWHSFWITDFMFLYAHINKPIPEFLLCIPASVMLNYLVLRTGSVYPSFLVHYLFGMSLNLIVYFS